MTNLKKAVSNKTNWDQFFSEVCRAVATNSKCLSRKIGAVLVRDKSIIATGYNGPPRGVMPCNERLAEACLPCDPLMDEMSINQGASALDDYAKCPRYMLGYESGQGLHLCPAAHAEANCINNAALNGVNTKGATMYMTCSIPCQNCLTAIINAGVKEIVVTGMEFYDSLSEYIVKSSGLRVRLYAHLLKDTLTLQDSETMLFNFQLSM